VDSHNVRREAFHRRAVSDVSEVARHLDAGPVQQRLGFIQRRLADIGDCDGTAA
jgi:hypothetical protein